MQYQEAFEHFHAQLINDIQGKRGHRLIGIKVRISFEHDAAMYY
ncbi:hypothetical protein MM1S1540310_4972 [Mycobacteroides abscessus subsp. bolletii 1S-154-0310]|nr:hypothetical protein MM1S1530915_4966 [Mycobacteroides abscessus subsp. bolletii 1S-153-0915]EIU72340.1 hypothetical protein MM1S1520914_0635 [Mycobacteroides abscessus subsp. bolletii 1S-152-0914]EIU75733.1 hypothetical protein MM1S1540310_4972 [Mycobacteroides abscessus subsp. bolletii 1S-154-0310]SHS79906.1 Uncharacterised protein [Mycobacteroides abscessus subsp. abscessus]SKH59134.1 Uncharacterised protein [Mycobacteroides abscessus subsp. massiliense]